MSILELGVDTPNRTHEHGRTLIGIGFGFAVLSLVSGCAAKATVIATNVVVCGEMIPLPDVLPPAGSGPVLLMALPCAVSLASGEESIPQDYRRYIELQPSRPADDVWVSWDADATQTMQDDFRRLWDTGQLGDLTIEVTDYPFPNGVIGKFVTFRMQER
jgi:hypothetical protein